MAYHVYIERSQDPSAEGIKRVAAAVGERYGFPAATIEQRMTQGRFRVKANCDMRTAARFAADLERLGAVCTIVEEGAGGEPVPKAATSSRPPAIPNTPARIRPPAQARATVLGTGTPAPTVAAPAEAAAPAASPTGSSTGQYQSGLAAAFSPETSSQDIGVLRNTDSGLFRLSTIDGADEAARVEAEPVPPAAVGDNAFLPPDAEDEEIPLDTEVPQVVAADGSDLAAPSGPVADAAFLPPDAEDEDLELHTPAPELVAPQPPPSRPTPAAAVGDEDVPIVEAAPATAGAGNRRPRDVRALLRSHVVARPRVRFAAGIFLVILFGFVPARLYFGLQADSAQDAINASMREPITLAQSDASHWEELEEIGYSNLALGKSRLFNARITSMLLWLGVSGGLAYVYFRRIDWDGI